MGINKILKNAVQVCLFLVMLLPLPMFIFGMTSYFPFIVGKNIVFRILIEVALAIWLILIIGDKESRPQVTLTLYAVGAFLLSITLATVFGDDPSRSFWSNAERMEGLVTHIHLFFFFLMLVSTFDTKKVWSWFFHLAITVGTFSAIYGLYQFGGALAINQGGLRVDGTFGNSIYMAIYMVFTFFIALMYLIERKEKQGRLGDIAFLAGVNLALVYGVLLIGKFRDSGGTLVPGIVGKIIFLVLLIDAVYILLRAVFKGINLDKFVYPLVMFLSLVVLYLTASRGPILGLIGGTVLVFLLYGLTTRGKAIKFALIAMIALLALLAVFFTFKNTDYVQKSPRLGRFATISLSETTTQSRFIIWGMALESFSDNPILGVGPENFISVFGKYFDPRLYRQEPWFDRTHNAFLDWLVSAGILGFLSYLSLFIVPIYILWKRAKDVPLMHKSLITGLVMAYAFHVSLVFDNLMSYVYFFSFISYISFLSYPKLGAKVLNNKLISHKSEFGYERIIAGALATLLAVLAVYSVNIKGIIANKNVLHIVNGAKIETLADGSQNFVRLGLRDRIDLAKETIEMNTFMNSELREQLTFLAMSVASDRSYPPEQIKEVFDLANKEIDEEISKNPDNPRALIFKGAMLRVYKRFDDALVYIKKAEASAPNKQTLIFEEGLVYSEKGDYKLALETFKRAYDLEPNYSQAIEYYASALILNNNFDEATKIIEPYMDTELIYKDSIVNAYITRGYLNIATKLLEKKYLDGKSNLNDLLKLAAIYSNTGRREDAIAKLEEIVLKDPRFKAQAEQYISIIKSGKGI